MFSVILSGKSVNSLKLPVSLMALVLFGSSCNPAEASYFFRGANGQGTVYNQQGRYGSRVGGRFRGPNGGASYNQNAVAGPNGGSFNNTSANAYKSGCGGVHKGSWNGTTPNGATGSGSSQCLYNAQTGQGMSTSNAQVTNAAGQNYGYTGNTNFTKGQGGTSVIQTDNHGTYDVNFAKGSKPVVTPVE